jgi:hypothetical protein
MDITSLSFLSFMPEIEKDAQSFFHLATEMELAHEVVMENKGDRLTPWFEDVDAALPCFLADERDGW